MRIGLVLSLLFATACVVQSPPQQSTGSPPPATSPNPPQSTGPTANKAADGAPCDSADDCESGVCEGEGCGAGLGTCVSRDRTCTTDVQSYCGCDGKTFQSSGSCPNGRYVRRGACEQKGAAGSGCVTGADCESGVCEGEGCGTADGVCAAKKRMCTRDLVAYCGCDGVTFRASGSCPGRRYQAAKACEAARGAPAGSRCNSGADCESGTCEGQGCGPNQGVCVPRSRVCTRDLQTYCGCDGNTFRGSGSCPMRRYKKRGPC